MPEDTKAPQPKETPKEEKIVAKRLSDGELVQHRSRTKAILDAQPKRSVRLRPDANPKAPNYETVCINDYLFQIQKGVEVEVPEEVYLILVRANIY